MELIKYPFRAISLLLLSLLLTMISNLPVLACAGTVSSLMVDDKGCQLTWISVEQFTPG